MFKQFLQKKMELLVQEYFVTHPEIKLIAVAGSVGKTTTKNVIATILSEKYKIGGALKTKNYNTEFSVPFSILGIKYPKNIKSPIAWMQVFREARRKIRSKADVDIIIQELGVDKPGDMGIFQKYLQPDIAILTAVTPEHLATLKDMETVTREETSIFSFSKTGYINKNDVDYEKVTGNVVGYGIEDGQKSLENQIRILDFSEKKGFKCEFSNRDEKFEFEVKMFGEHVLKSIVVGIAIGLDFGLSVENIKRGISKIVPVYGRMNLLDGINSSTIIDDSYNSSPVAVQKAINTLYEFTVEGEKIAILGSMNELGPISEEAHREVGKMCDPKKLKFLVTVGEEAEKFIAEEANKNGCEVYSFKNAREAGEFVKKKITKNSIILVKGSQGDIYLEETIKSLLRDPADVSKLVRQSKQWMKIKEKFFAENK